MTSLSLSTDDLAARERAGQWCEWVGSHFGGLRTDVYGDALVEGRILADSAGEVVLTRLQASRHRVHRSQEHARHGEEAYLKIVAPWQGASRVRQDGREAWAHTGQWVAYDTTASYAVDNPGACDHLIVMLPKARVGLDAATLARALGRTHAGVAGISRIALEAMRSTYQELPVLSAEAARGAGEALVHLVRLSLLELAGQAAENQPLALADRIRHAVALRLREPDLSADSIAQALGCSRRSVYQAIAASPDWEPELSLQGYIQRCRLQACMQALRADRGRSVTDIAFEWGFVSSSHFSRAFRAHAGLSPSDYRAQQS
ncbi:MAG: Transcriptional activator FeaR [Paracidovorax wautersii]|uniref:Transcriptional activator FeaR n=1 Tax=Paracidovorax wautersii TaxID=1177982 RepID=A0A7V8FLQ5_9BURK|nr:MAG: Transcriptional activator FeaR [Paracidovorax wautersii]